MNRALTNMSEDKENVKERVCNCNNANGFGNCCNTLNLDFVNQRKYSVQEECLFDNRRKQHLIDLRCMLTSGSNDQDRKVEFFVKLFQTQEILERLFEIFDYYQYSKLNQEQWIDSLKAKLNQFYNGTTKPQIEFKYLDFIEVLESVTYAVCGDEAITLDTFCKIFKTKNVLNKLFHLLVRDLDGVITNEQVIKFISQLSSPRSGSRLTKESIVYLENLFRQYVGEEIEIKKDTFSKIIQTKNQFFTDRVFDIFDEDASGSISLQDFLGAMHRFANGNPEDKVRFLFKVYDVNGDGLIQENELEQVMRACMEENGMKFSDEQIHELTIALFEDADVEGLGALTYDALKGQMEKHEGLLENLSISIERWLVPVKPIGKSDHEPSLITKLLSLKPHQLSRKYLKNNCVYVFWLFGLIITNCVLFLTRVFMFRESHPGATLYLVLARGAGQCLNFNCTFIVVVMLKQTLTFLRSHGASAILPIDQHIYFHKLTGMLIFIFGSLHTVAHFLNIEYGPRNRHFTYLQYLFDPNANMFGLFYGFAYNTGVILMLILIVMVICSLPFVRRGGSFEIFYYTHLLYLGFWTFLLIHAPDFWKWFLVPGLIFKIEKIVSFYHWRVQRGKTYISSGILLPSKVTQLVIKRPHNFDFRPGDYVFVRIPRIAKYEWHPFTISSSPEQEDTIWLHIRGVGGWTNRLHQYFQEEQSYFTFMLSQVAESLDFQTTRRQFSTTSQDSAILSVRYMRNKPRIISLEAPSNDQNERRQSWRRKKINANFIDDTNRAAEEGRCNNMQQNEIGAEHYLRLEIFIDGPYGAPSSQVLFRAEHAVLIATGIGVTPFASILQSIMRRYWASRNTCPNCCYTFCSDISQTVLNLQKVDFFWINRDQKSFEWFVHLLSQLEIEQAELGGAMERFLDMHMYITSALQRTDMKAVVLQLALDLLHEKDKRDLITGLKTRTNAGRPNWNKIFQQLQDQKKGKVTVFYCGPPSLARTLKIKCDEFGFSFQKEQF